MSEQNQNLASNSSKKYTYRSEPKQISFRVSESEFAKLKQSAEALQMSVPAFVKAKAQNARLVTPKVAPDIAQAIARDLAKAGGNINQIAKWCNTHQHDVAPDDAQRLSENLKTMQKELQKIWQQLK
ncbi:MobC family plasmid mobilization relaxosome protein [Enterococcus hirae]|nr:MobC family plasmid mobilization relaxosome protein [Enterococcus hirae]